MDRSRPVSRRPLLGVLAPAVGALGDVRRRLKGEDLQAFERGLATLTSAPQS